MSVIRRDCPHCGTRNQSFNLQHAYVMGSSERTGRGGGGSNLAAMFECGYCKKPITVRYDPVTDTTEFQAKSGANLDKSQKAVTQWPEYRQAAAPEHTPQPIAGLYRQALDNIRMQNWDSAGMALRKVLETSVNHIGEREIPEGDWPAIRARGLAQRMKALAERHLITPGLADWAHELRESGNGAAHDEAPYSKDEALLMRDIAELLLIYLFKLPETLRLRQEERASAAAS